MSSAHGFQTTTQRPDFSQTRQPMYDESYQDEPLRTKGQSQPRAHRSRSQQSQPDFQPLEEQAELLEIQLGSDQRLRQAYQVYANAFTRTSSRISDFAPSTVTTQTAYSNNAPTGPHSTTRASSRMSEDSGYRNPTYSQVVPHKPAPSRTHQRSSDTSMRSNLRPYASKSSSRRSVASSTSTASTRVYDNQQANKLIVFRNGTCEHGVIVYVRTLHELVDECTVKLALPFACRRVFDW